MSKLNKITHGKIDFKLKSAEMSSYKMDKIMSPYDGEVVKTHSANCPDGYLVIRHYIDGVLYYSQFCGISNGIASLGDKVRGGATIGFFSDKPITYSVLTSNFEFLNPESFLNETLFKPKEPSKDKKPSKDKEPKDKEPKEPRGEDEYEINALAPVTLPIEFAYRSLSKGAKKVGKELKKMGKGMFQLHNKEKDDRLKKAREDKDNDDNDQSLNENIQRIKKLLK